MKMFFVSGGPITGYWVEKREENTDKWIPVNISPIQSTHYTVPSLLEDHVYEFRVIAENEAGKGSPSEASKLTRVKKSFCFFLIFQN
jgi:titin